MPAEKTTVKPSVRDVLAGAVESLGGQERPGQIQMVEAVARAMSSGEHLLVQAGTGTGKSLGYLVPALLHHRRVVVATATLALQHQLVERDIPALLDAAEHLLAPGDEQRRATYAVLKGRSNYACLHRVREGAGRPGRARRHPEGTMGAEVLGAPRLGGGGVRARRHRRPGLRPKHTDKLWRQVSVNHRECLGAAKCPYAAEFRGARQGEGGRVAGRGDQPLPCSRSTRSRASR